MDEQQFPEWKAVEVPETYRQIMFRELNVQFFPTRRKITDRDDLERLGLSLNELVEMTARALSEKVAKALAKTEERDFTPEDSIGIDEPLRKVAVARLLENKLLLRSVIDSELGPLRLRHIEEGTREVLQAKTTPTHPYTQDEAVAAIGKIRKKERTELAESVTRTISECVDQLVALVEAYLDRTYSTKEHTYEAMSEDEARLRGPATSEMFYRAVEPVIEDAERALVIGPALAALPALDSKLKAPHTLHKQLAPKRFLGRGQDKQLADETAARSHFPFGLQRPGSLAILVAAVYLSRAECSSTIIRASRPELIMAQGPAALFIPTLNTLNAVTKEKSESESRRGWSLEYSTTPGAMDCLRAAAPLLSTDQAPQFLRIPPPERPYPPGEDPAHRLINAALPLDKQPKDSKKPWFQTSWVSFGHQLLQDVNIEHRRQKGHPCFHDDDFLTVAAQHTTDVLTELVKLLQRGEGVATGLPNTRSTYNHLSVISLNNLLSTASRTLFNTAFKDYRIRLDKTIVDTRTGNTKKKCVNNESAEINNDLPQGVMLLTLDSVRTALKMQMFVVEHNQWAYTDSLTDPDTFSVETARETAVEMIEVVIWAERNESLLQGLSLDEILTKYYLYQETLGNPPPEPEALTNLRKQLFDVLLSDTTVKRILKSLDTTPTEPDEDNEDNEDNDHDS